MGLTPLNSPPDIGFSRNPIYLHLNTDNSDCEAITMKLTIKKLDGTDEIYSEFSLDTDRDGNVLFSINELLDNSLDKDPFPLPTLSATTIQENNNKIRYFYYECEEIESGAPNGQKHIVDEGSAKYVVMGGDSRLLWPTMKWFEDVQSAADPNFEFCNTKPSFVPISTTHPEFLYFFNHHTSAFTAMLKVIITKLDGTTTTLTKYAGTLIDSRKRVIIPVGYTALGLSANDTAIATNPIISYSVQLFENSSTNEKSAARIIYLDRKYYGINERLFYFYNSLGGFDCYRMSGGFTAESNLEGQSKSNYVTPNLLTEYTPDRVNQQRKENVSFKGDSGLIPPKEIKYLRELMLSPMVYEYDMAVERKYLIPVEIISNKVVIDEAENKPKPMAFEYRRLYDEHSLNAFLI
jgi:hypothetical protein